MTPGTRARRLDNEWQAMGRLAECNPGVLVPLERTSREGRELFKLRLCQSGGLRLRVTADRLLWNHTIELRFPRFYPAVPLEAYLAETVFHPNVDPAKGFVCLWDKASPADTSVDAVRRVQAILAWKMFNLDPPHVMQPQAAEWLATRQAEFSLPLPYVTIREPGGRHLTGSTSQALGSRRRLSTWTEA